MGIAGTEPLTVLSGVLPTERYIKFAPPQDIVKETTECRRSLVYQMKIPVIRKQTTSQKPETYLVVSTILDECMISALRIWKMQRYPKDLSSEVGVPGPLSSTATMRSASTKPTTRYVLFATYRQLATAREYLKLRIPSNITIFNDRRRFRTHSPNQNRDPNLQEPTTRAEPPPLSFISPSRLENVCLCTSDKSQYRPTHCRPIFKPARRMKPNRFRMARVDISDRPDEYSKNCAEEPTRSTLEYLQAWAWSIPLDDGTTSVWFVTAPWEGIGETTVMGSAGSQLLGWLSCWRLAYAV
ncbi:hypothetical protein EV361DRAFT_864152 [Lentinula raphanica]|nr:hypothetical protein F5880DRAFT_1504089 [Lentinula raphanica]KAJ3977056.1 hypothetical protein EV361DRAFT_864152 [Lentinula raphanica]